MAFKNLVVSCALVVGMMSFCYGQEEMELSCMMITVDRNRLCFEKYNLEDLQDGVMYLSKQDRASHCLLEVIMNEPGEGLIGATWDSEILGNLAIHTGKKGTPCSYLFDVLSLFIPEETENIQAVAWCFDCAMMPVSEELMQRDHEKPWVACAQLTMPVADGVNTVYFVFDHKVRSVCGLFVSNCIFTSPLRFTGKMKKRVVLDCGLLKLNMADRAVETEANTNEEQQVPQTTSERSAPVQSESTALIVQEQELLNHVVQELVQSEQLAEQIVLAQEKELVQQAAPTVLGILQQQTVSAFKVLRDYVAYVWNYGTSFLFATK